MEPILKRFSANPLAKEITVVLLVKLCLIFALWYGFFRDPIDRGLTDVVVSAAILGPAGAEAPAR